MFAIAGLLTVRALELRVPHLHRPMWLDECVHNYAIVSARSLLELPSRVAYMSQPVLEYVLRREVWIPLLGVSERAMRLPSLVCSLLSLLGVVALSTLVLVRRGCPGPVVALGVCLAGVWLVKNPAEIHLAAEARHYSFVSLVSICWFSAWLLWERCPAPVFALLSLLFANAHFFSLPAIGTAYGLDGIREFRRGGWAALIRHAGWGLAVLVPTAVVNAAALNILVRYPPGTSPAGAGAVLASGAVCYWNCVQTLAVPVHLFGLWTGLCFVWRRERVRYLLAFALLVLPAFLFYTQLRSDYGFGARYFMPFFGLGFVSLVTAFSIGYDVWRTAAVPFTRMVRVAAGMACAIGLLAIFGVPRVCWRLPREFHHIEFPPANFSPFFKMYDEVKRADRPVLILHQGQSNADEIPRLYFHHLGVPIAHPVLLVPSRGEGVSRAEARRMVASFLADYPENLVLLDHKERDCPEAVPPRGTGSARVWKVHAGKLCVWFVQGAKDLAALRSAARAVGFWSVETWFHR